MSYYLEFISEEFQVDDYVVGLSQVQFALLKPFAESIGRKFPIGHLEIKRHGSVDPVAVRRATRLFERLTTGWGKQRVEPTREELREARRAGQVITVEP
jgi:hypothetical protein